MTLQIRFLNGQTPAESWDHVQEIQAVQARLLLRGAAHLEHQGFLDAAADLLEKHTGLLGGETPSKVSQIDTAEARLALRLQQLKVNGGSSSDLHGQLAKDLRRMTALQSEAQVGY